MEHAIRHLSNYMYDPAALNVYLRLKLFPVDYEGQEVQDWKVTINGEEIQPLILTGLADREGLWRSGEKSEQIEIIAEGHVRTRDTSGIVRGLPGNPPPGIYLQPSTLTEPDEAIRKLAADIIQDDRLAAMHTLMGHINENIKYLTDASDTATTAAETLKAGQGVCQDQAQLFIATARAAGVPCRYVTGYLQMDDAFQAQTQGSDGQSQSQSSGSDQLLETHAWAEAFIDGLGWIGFDPSNNVCPTENYVRLCSGHDAFGAAPIRGNVVGETSETLEVSVAIGHAQQ